MAEDGRRILIIAGPNGAGKTTFAREYLLREANCPTFVNADLIAAGLSPFRPESAAFQAGRLMLAEIARHAAAGISFGFETTLSGRGYARMIPRWQGGHDVPQETIRRRFHAGKNNFASLYRHLVDSWALYDNSGEGPELKGWSSRHD